MGIFDKIKQFAHIEESKTPDEAYKTSKEGRGKLIREFNEGKAPQKATVAEGTPTAKVAKAIEANSDLAAEANERFNDDRPAGSKGQGILDKASETIKEERPSDEVMGQMAKYGVDVRKTNNDAGHTTDNGQNWPGTEVAEDETGGDSPQNGMLEEYAKKEGAAAGTRVDMADAKKYENSADDKTAGGRADSYNEDVDQSPASQARKQQKRKMEGPKLDMNATTAAANEPTPDVSKGDGGAIYENEKPSQGLL